MWGCHYCTRAHKQWARFNDDVDDVVPLAMGSVEAVLPDQAMQDQAMSDQAMSGTQAFSNWMEGLSSKELRRAQSEDPNIDIVINWLEHSYEPTTRELQLNGPETRALWLNRDFLKLQDGIILNYSWANLEGCSDCLVVPLELGTRLLYYSHDWKGSGHVGQKKALDRLKQRFYWHGMSKDSNIYVK